MNKITTFIYLCYKKEVLLWYQQLTKIKFTANLTACNLSLMDPQRRAGRHTAKVGTYVLTFLAALIASATLVGAFRR
jgi:hypothetical protein